MPDIKDVSTVAIKKDNKFLIQKRSKTSSGAGYWNFPGGSVEDGETLAGAAVREIKEESGLNISEKDLVYLDVLKRGNLRIHFYYTDKFTGEVTINKESDDYAWITLDEFKNYLFVGSGNLDAKIFNALKEV